MNRVTMISLAFASLFCATNVKIYANIDKQIASYEKSKSVQTTVNTLYKKKLGKSKGLCAKYVRLGYMSSGLIPSHPGINYAKNYKPYFEKNRWKNLIVSSTSSKWSKKLKKDLFKTPNGCSIVYDSQVPQNDRNGYIGHIEVRVKKKGALGFISDYYSGNPRTGLNCARKGKKVKRLKTFRSRKSGKTIKRYINVTSCLKHNKTGAFVSDEWKNRKVTGIFCKL